MNLKFQIVFVDMGKEVMSIPGHEISEERSAALTIGELVEKVHETEAFLEKLTGLRVHINQVL